MTAAELVQQQMAQQQVMAAWVSAGAAVVQAAGAVAAIWFTGKLARESAKREETARLASEARERLADEAAERRAREADQAADRRVREAGEAAAAQEGRLAQQSTSRARIAAFEVRLESIRTAKRLGEAALLKLHEGERSWREQGQSIAPGRHLSETYHDTHTALAALPPPADDPDAQIALAALVRDTSPGPVGLGGTAQQIADTFHGQAVRIEADLAALEGREEATRLAVEAERMLIQPRG